MPTPQSPYTHIVLHAGSNVVSATACFDSGCQTSMIPESVLYKIGNIKVNNSNVVVKGVDSDTGFKADGEVELDVNIDSKFKIFRVKFLVTRKQIPVLLGMNVIQKFKLFEMVNGTSLNIQPEDGYPVYSIKLVTPTTAFKLSQQSPPTVPMAKPASNATPDQKLTWLKTMKGVQLNHSNQSELDQVVEILFEHEQAIGCEYEKLGTFPKPVKIRTRPHSEKAIVGNHVPQALQAAADAEIQRMEQMGVISKCPDPKGWNSPVFAVKKPSGAIRIVANFKNTLNASLTEVDPYPTPSTTNIFTGIGAGNKYFCTADLRSGYWQFKLDEESKPKTAFNWKGDTWMYEVLPFGMTDSGALFSRNVHEAVSVLGNDGYLRYVDDNLIYAKDFDTFKKRLVKFLKVLIQNGLKLNASKCTFITDKAKFLGRVLTTDGIEADKEYVDALLSIPPPTNRKELLSLLGRIVWLKAYVETNVGERIGTQCFSALINEMTRLSSSKVPFEWTSLAAKQFLKVKKKLSSPPVVAFPDWSKAFILITDASDVAVGGVIMQHGDDGTQKIIATCSHKLSSTEQRWSTIERECYGLIYSIRKFKYFLEGRKFFIKTDHKPLVFLDKRDYNNAKIRRWQQELQQYTFTICHIAGTDNGIADLLSRPAGNKADNGEVADDVPAGAVYENTDGSIQFYVPSWCTPQPIPDTLMLRKTSTTVAKVLSARLTGGEPTHDKLHLSRDQNDDATLQKIKQFLLDKRNGKPVGEIADILNGADETPYKKYAKDMTLGHGTDAVYIMNHGLPRIVVPKKMISTFLHTAHDLTGHHGISRMRSYLAHYYWPGKYNDITQYVNTCKTCAQRKGNYGHPSHPDMGHCQRGSRPFTDLTIDFVGPLTDSNGKKYICTILDNFSRFFAGYACKTDSATDASRAVFKFMTQHRVTPEIIGSDRGSHFTGKVFQETLRLFGIQHRLHVAWRPQSSGNLERNHRVLKNSLFAVCNETNAKWDSCLDLVISNMNAMPNNSTKVSPHFVIYGRHPTMFLPTPPSELTSTSALSYGMAISNQSRVVQRLVTLAASEADVALEKRYNAGTSNVAIRPGDDVLLYRPNSAEAKRTKMPWLQGYQVVKSNGLVVKLKHSNGQMDWCHRHHIRLMKKRPQHLLYDLNMLIPPVPTSPMATTIPSYPPRAPTVISQPNLSNRNLPSGGDGEPVRDARPIREKKKPKRLIETMDPKLKSYFSTRTSSTEARSSLTDGKTSSKSIPDCDELMELMFMVPDVNDGNDSENVLASVYNNYGCPSAAFDTNDDATADEDDDATTDGDDDASSLESDESKNGFEGDSLDDVNGTSDGTTDDIKSIHSSEMTKSSSDTEIVENFADILDYTFSSPRTPSPTSPLKTCPNAPHKTKTLNRNEWVEAPQQMLHIPLEKTLSIEEMARLRKFTTFFKIKSMKDLNCDELKSVQSHYNVKQNLKWNIDDKLDFVMAKRKLAETIRKNETDVRIYGIDNTTKMAYPIIGIPYKYSAASENISGIEIRALDWFQLMTHCIKNKVNMQKDDIVSRESILNVILKSAVT